MMRHVFFAVIFLLSNSIFASGGTIGLAISEKELSKLCNTTASRVNAIRESNYEKMAYASERIKHARALTPYLNYANEGIRKQLIDLWEQIVSLPIHIPENQNNLPKLYEASNRFTLMGQEGFLRAAWGWMILLEKNYAHYQDEAFMAMKPMAAVLARTYANQTAYPVYLRIVKEALSFLSQKDPQTYLPMYQTAFIDAKVATIKQNVSMFLKHQNTQDFWNGKVAKFEAAFSIFFLSHMPGNSLKQSNKQTINQINAYCAKEIEGLFSREAPPESTGLFMNQMQIMMEFDPFNSQRYKEKCADHLVNILEGTVFVNSTSDELKISAAKRLFHSGFDLSSHKNLIEDIATTTTQGYIREIAQGILKKI